MAIQIGRKLCWGLNLEWRYKPITNLPPNTISVRRRIRADQAAVAIILLPRETQEWILAPDVEALKLDILVGVESMDIIE